MNTDSSNNLIGGVSLIANSNMQSQQFEKAATVVKNGGSVKDQKAAAEKFESMFIGEMFKMMFDTVPVDQNFGGGEAEDTFRGFLVDEYGNLVSKAGGFGIAKKIEQAAFSRNNPSAQVMPTQATEAYNKVYNHGGNYGSI